MSCADQYTPILRARGLRVTAQRKAILHALCHAGGHLSPTQVFARARKDYPRLTEPTVYRALEELTAKKMLLSAHIGNGKMVYELAEQTHHHLICRACGKSASIQSAALEALYAQLGDSAGYLLDASHVTLFGLCPQCQKN